MRFLRLDLRAFGPFSGVSLDLSAGCEGFHLVYGPNEAGKSSALRALRNLLYGIPGNTTDDFLHNKPSLRIGAALVRRDGQTLEIVRRKGTKGTLLPADEMEPLEESVLRSFLGGCDQAQFEMMFGIDHAGLIAGGKEIICGQGDIGHVLFAAGAGISDLRAIRNNLEKQADDLFSPRGLKPAVNRAIGELSKAKKLIRERQLPSSEWQKHNVALDEATRQLTEVEGRLGELSRRKARMQRLNSALPAIGRLRECNEKILRLGDVPVLPADFTENRRDTVTRLETARQSEQAAVVEISRLDGLIDALAVPEGLLSLSEEIESAYKELSVYRKAQNDLPGLTAQREQLEKGAAVLLHDLRPELTLADAGQLQLSRRQQVEIQNLGNRHDALVRQQVQARSEIVESRHRLVEASDQLEKLSLPLDPAPLAETLRQARVQGNLSQQADALRAEIDTLAAQAEIDLNKLGLWQGSLDDLEKLALPAVETIERFDRSLSDSQSSVARLQSQRDKVQSDTADIDRDLQRLHLEGEVPSEAELAEARTIRDAGWRLVLQDWRNEAKDKAAVATFLSAAGDNDLAAAYEQTVRRADDLSDRLRREANRVASRAGLQSRRISLEQQSADLTKQYATAQTQHQQIDGEWQQAWHDSGIKPLSPREMQAWMQRQQGLVHRAQMIRERSTSLVRLEELIFGLCRQMQGCLENLGEIPAENETVLSLDSLVFRGDTLLERIRETAVTRRQLEGEKIRLENGVTSADAKFAQADADLAEWRVRWTAAIEPLGQPTESSPAAINAVVAQTAELFARLSEAASFAERIEGITRDSHRFCQEMQRLLLKVGPDQPLPVGRFQENMEDLVARLRRAITDQKSLDLLQSQREKQEEKRQQAISAEETLGARLAMLCQEARCQNADELAAAETASAAVLGLRQERHLCQDQLLQLAAGATIEALMAEAMAISPDSLSGEMQQIAEEMADLERTRGEQREAIGGEKAVLVGMQTGAAAEAAEDFQEILARLEPDVYRYLRLRLAIAILREGIERYRTKNEGPVLGRASDLFRRLTLGSFDALRIDFDDRGEQVLAGVRPDGKTVLPTAMSEGSCDQLYLALRLASLDIWLERSEPMPFIVDDILVSFDNQRAAATLKVLAELSTRTQVVFFAHHEHLVELAKESLPADVLFVHRL